MSLRAPSSSSLELIGRFSQSVKLASYNTLVEYEILPTCGPTALTAVPKKSFSPRKFTVKCVALRYDNPEGS